MFYCRSNCHAGKYPTLHTDRLILRRFALHDDKAPFALLRDEEVNRFLPWFPFASLGQAQAHLQSFYLDSYRLPFGCRYAVCMRGNDVPIGYVHLSQTDSHDFGYALRRECWGQGIIPEAGRAVLAWLKGQGLPFVTATHDRENPNSGRVLQKLGLRYCYSYTEQWQPKISRLCSACTSLGSKRRPAP
ncbi:MAG: GNAT family N-acetyltransferase [Christensenellales bacterium]